MNLTLSLLLPLTVANGGPFAGPPNCTTCAPTPPPRVAVPAYFPPRPMFGQACPPIGPPAPVLTTTFSAPTGVRITLFDGGPGKMFPTPTTAGLRPGYTYRFELSNLPNHPNESLYPVLEVRGSLVPRPTMKPADYPAPVVITQSDIEKAMIGVLVTKIIYLENPEKAIPIAVKPGEPLEVGHDLVEDAYQAAKDNGRVVAILRFGSRKPDADEMAAAGVAGTVLMPGDNYLSAPSAPPCLPWSGIPLFDPVLGPKPTTEECLTDGGDKGVRIGIGPDGKLNGLNPTDVAVEYSQSGKRKVTTSNEVCLCVPRFAVRRSEIGLGRMQQVTGPEASKQLIVPVGAYNRTPPQVVAAREKPVGFDSRVRPAVQVGGQSLAGIGSLTKLAGRGTVQGLLVVASEVGVDEITSFPDQLVVTKEVDPKGPLKVGDTVTFTIRYRNNTRQPISDVVVSDSLSGRLEYVAGSAASDRPANVTTSANEADSVVVRFELPGALASGQGGVVKFQAKIR